MNLKNDFRHRIHLYYPNNVIYLRKRSLLRVYDGRLVSLCFGEGELALALLRLRRTSDYVNCVC